MRSPPNQPQTAADLLRDELPLRRGRWLVLVAMASLVALACIRLWLVRGLIQVHRVEGSSMGPSLPGAHFRLNCGDCGFQFRCGSDQVPTNELLTCPNCGYARNELATASLHPGERVLVDGWPLVWRLPRRGEIVMAASPDSSPLPIVKRVAVLPHEKLSIRSGDLFANGKRLRKTLPELRQVATLVHDDDFQPRRTRNLQPRWQGETSDARWRQTATGYRFLANADGDSETFDWLLYHHWPCVGPPLPRTASAPVLDNDSFNQALSRELNEVGDLLVRCQVQWRGEGRFSLALSDGNDRFAAVCEPASRSVRLLHGEREVLSRKIDWPTSNFADVILVLCDQQAIVALQGQVLISHLYESLRSANPVLHPVAIGATGMDVDVSHLQVWRDIYHLEPLGTSRRWEADDVLPAEHVALLGDNPTVSVDSRHWQAAGVPRTRIFGLVYALDR